MPIRWRGLLAGVSHMCLALLVMAVAWRRTLRCPGRITALFLKCLMFSLLIRTASALDPSRTIKQFDHTSWTVRQGAPSGIIALAQTTDGFLWMATGGGVVRFDGVTFEVFRPRTGPAFPQSDVSALMATADGGLWIGYRLGGSSFLKDGVLTNYSFPEGTVWDFKVGNDGTLWMAGGFSGGLARLTRGEWERVGTKLGFTPASAVRMLFDRHGNLWVASLGGTVWLLNSGANQIQNTEMSANTGARFVETSDGAIWWLNQKGVARLSESDAPGVKAVSYPILTNNASALLVDRDGTLWAFDHGGVLRLPSTTQLSTVATSQRVPTLQHFSTQDGLTSGYITDAIEDREGNIWIVTPSGLDRFRMTTFAPALLAREALFGFALSAAEGGKVFAGTGSDNLLSLQGSNVRSTPGVKMENILCLYRSPDRKLWIAGIGELSYFLDDRYVPISLSPGLKGIPTSTQAMTYDAGGALWISTVKHTISILKDGHWKELEPPEGFPRTAASLFTDRKGQVWAGYMGGKIAVYGGKTVRRYSERDGLSTGNVMTIYETGSDIWVAGQYGINLFREDRFIPLRFRDHFEVGGVTGIVEGSDGSLWMNTKSGIVSVPGEEVHEFLKSYDHPISFTRYDVLDGVNGSAPQLRPLPSAIRATDGRLWFALDGDVVSVDPLHVFRSKMIPPVSILRVKSGAGLQQTGDSSTSIKERTISRSTTPPAACLSPSE